MNKKQPGVQQQVDVKFKQSKEKIFALVKDEKNKIHICMGGFLVSQESFDTFNQAETYIDTKPWEIIINCAATILTKNEEMAKVAEKANKEN